MIRSYDRANALNTNTVELKAGVDGTVWGLRPGSNIRYPSNKSIYTYTPAAGWVYAATGLQTAGGNSISHISVGNGSQVLALTTATSNNVFVLNSAKTGWNQLGSIWLSTAEIGADGDVWGINFTTSTIYHRNGTSWQSVAGQLSNLAVGSATNVWGVNASYQLFLWNGSAWKSIAANFNPSNSVNGIASAVNSSLAALDSSGGIHLSSDGGVTWSVIQGTASSIAGGSAAATFTLNASSVYHVNRSVPTITNSGSGVGVCPIGGCPSGSGHTVTSKASFGGAGGAHGTAGVTVTMTGAPTAILTAPATEDGSNCDLFFGNPSAPECQASTYGNVICSVMGSQATSSGSFTFDAELAFTQVWWGGTPPPYCYFDLYGISRCNYPVANNCTPATTPPDNDFTGQQVDTFDYRGIYSSIAWMTMAPCYRFAHTGPWKCVHGGACQLRQTFQGHPHTPAHTISDEEK